MRLLLLNGPNINLLGQREPGLYGHQTLLDIELRLRDRASEAEVQLSLIHISEPTRPLPYQGSALPLSYKGNFLSGPGWI